MVKIKELFLELAKRFLEELINEKRTLTIEFNMKLNYL
jgi:plasmid maintenance system antidote protein VapI